MLQNTIRLRDFCDKGKLYTSIRVSCRYRRFLITIDDDAARHYRKWAVRLSDKIGKI